MNTKKSVIAIILTVFVIGLLLLSGPATAVVVNLAQPNDANKGSDVSFSTTVDIVDPDLLPVQYTTITLTGPAGIIETCQIDDAGVVTGCTDIDVTISKTGLSSVSGTQQGDDAGTNYNLGYGLGDKSTDGTGTITYDIVWHTPSTLADGTYSVQADVFAQGSASSHTFSSTSKSFSISTAPAPTSGGGGGGGGSHDYVNVPPIVTAGTPTVTGPGGAAVTPAAPTNTNPNAGMNPITGAAVSPPTGNSFTNAVRTFFLGIWNWLVGLFS